MSGVFALCSTAPGVDVAAITRAIAARLCHRPYHHVDVCNPGPAVGLGRHAIGIFNREPQPVVGSEGQVQLCLTGEFHHQKSNRADLASRTGLPPDAPDSALALAVYLAEGAEGVAALEGAFTTIIWDGRKQELVIVNDRFGLYPHYFAHVGRSFVIAPEIKGVLAVPLVPRKLDPVALAQTVRFQQFLGERTWFEDVQLLAPASVVRYQVRDSRLIEQRYWDLDRVPNQPATIGSEEASGECDRLFARAIEARSQPPHRVGIYLSGGLDSRLLLAYTRPSVKVTTLTFGAAACRDVVVARRVAQRLGARPLWFPLNDGRWILETHDLHMALTEGLHSFVHAHGMSTLDRAREEIDVNLTGWRSGGMLRVRSSIPPSINAVNEWDLASAVYPRICEKWTWPGLTEGEAYSLFSPPGRTDLRNLAFDSLVVELGRSAHYPEDRRINCLRFLQHDRRLTINFVVFTRSAVEVRCPFLDYRLFDFYWGLPASVREDQNLRRTMFLRRAPSVALIPYERDGLPPHPSRLVRNVFDLAQRTRGWINRHVAPVFPERPWLYADYERYLRTDLREWAEGILFDDRTRSRGLFNPDAVRALWERHLAGNELWTIGKVAPLINVELAVRHLLEEDAQSP